MNTFVLCVYVLLLLLVVVGGGVCLSVPCTLFYSHKPVTYLNTIIHQVKTSKWFKMISRMTFQIVLSDMRLKCQTKRNKEHSNCFFFFFGIFLCRNLTAKENPTTCFKAQCHTDVYRSDKCLCLSVKLCFLWKYLSWGLIFTKCSFTPILVVKYTEEFLILSV